MNAPNALTVVRILLAPVVVAALLEADGASVLAAAVFFVGASTDALDGYLARSRRSITTFGEIMDPIADKLLIGAALVTLVGLDRLAAWIAVLIIARELAVSGLRMLAGRQGVVITPSRLGRLKTTSQILAVPALMVANDPRAAWVMVLVYAALAVTLVSGAGYFLSYRRGESAPPDPGSRSATGA